MITQACKECEDWEEKDIIYTIGTVSGGALKLLWMVYGDCYAAREETYERVKNKISEGVNELAGVEFSETNELGRINKVDPLGVTYFRIRGMWGIDHPNKVFDYAQKFVELDLLGPDKRGKDGYELDVFWSAKFLESFQQTMTALARKVCFSFCTDPNPFK